MTNDTDNPLIPVTGKPGQDAPPPVRVTLRRVNANHAKNYPPDGETKVWWKRPKKAFGTTSCDFVNASLLQLQAAANLPSGGFRKSA
jgi:hypothetical protein